MCAFCDLYSDYVFVVRDPAPEQDQVLSEEKALGVCSHHFQDIKMEPSNKFSEG